MPRRRKKMTPAERRAQILAAPTSTEVKDGRIWIVRHLPDDPKLKEHGWTPRESRSS